MVRSPATLPCAAQNGSSTAGFGKFKHSKIVLACEIDTVMYLMLPSTLRLNGATACVKRQTHDMGVCIFCEVQKQRPMYFQTSNTKRRTNSPNTPMYLNNNGAKARKGIKQRLKTYAAGSGAVSHGQRARSHSRTS